MAELPRYTRSVRSAGVPDVQVPTTRIRDPQRLSMGAAAAVPNALISAIDRISGSLFKEAAADAEQRGLQYGVENAPTVEQIRASVAAGATPKELFVGGNSFFEQGARRAQAGLVAQALHAEGNKVIQGVLLDIEAGKVQDLDEVRARIEGSVNGLSKVLDQVSPEEALRLRATMATLGNAAYTKAADKIIAKQKDDAKIALEGQMQIAPKILEALIERGDVTDPASGKVITPEMQVEVYKQQLLRSLASIGDPEFAKQTLDRFNGLISKARVGVVSAHVTSQDFTRDPVQALQSVRAGAVGRVSGVYASLTQEEKDKVRQNLMAVIANSHTLDEQARAADKRATEEKVNGMLIAYHRMPEGPGKRTAALDIAREGQAIFSPETMRTLLRSDPESTTNPILVAKAEELIEAGLVRDLPYLNKLIPGLTAKEQVELQRKIFSQTNREETEAQRVLRNAAGIPEGPVFLDRSSEQAKAYTALTDAYRAKEEKARREQQPFNPLQAALEVRAEREKTIDRKAADAAKARLEVYEQEVSKKAGRLVTIDETTSIADLRALKAVDEQTLMAIERQQKVIRGAR
jgi:hypothetical protein